MRFYQLVSVFRRVGLVKGFRNYDVTVLGGKHLSLGAVELLGLATRGAGVGVQVVLGEDRVLLGLELLRVPLRMVDLALLRGCSFEALYVVR